MARDAALLLYWRVLKDKRPSRIDVAFGADYGLPRGCPHIARKKGAVRVVAIAARHQAFIDAMMFRLGKIRFNVSMAAVAQFGLTRDKQRMSPRGRIGMVDGMATKTADTVPEMGRAQEVLMAFRLLVTGQAALARLLGAQFGKSNNFAGITARVYVCFSGAMAGLAALPLRTLVFTHFCLPVRAPIITGGFGLMARFASVSANVQGRVRRLINGV
jgi:hypothetical protein